MRRRSKTSAGRDYDEQVSKCRTNCRKYGEILEDLHVHHLLNCVKCVEPVSRGVSQCSIRFATREETGRLQYEVSKYGSTVGLKSHLRVVASVASRIGHVYYA
jgi:hypothetical protein